MNRGVMSTIFLLMIALLCSLPARAESRVALVIGNDSYASLGRLSNAGNDARSMADKLQQLGFTLVGNQAHTDLTRTQASVLIKRFGETLKPGDVAFFYFAGHGVGGSDTNYLIPVDDQEIRFIEDVPEFAIDAQSVLRRMEQRGAGINLVILDACRDRGLPSRTRSGEARGLSRMKAPSGSFIGYAASPGQRSFDGKGSNGVFTEQLLSLLDRPGLSMDDIFGDLTDAVERATGNQQTPMRESNLRGRFYLVPPLLAAVESKPTEPKPVEPKPVDPKQAERLAFEAAERVNTVAAWSLFLKRYPKSDYAAAAELKQMALQPVEAVVPPKQPATTVVSNSSSVAQDVSIFRDCAECPEMIRIPGGSFLMGDLSGKGESDEKPVHRVNLKPFAVGKFEVTFAEWDACVAAGGCQHRPGDKGLGRDKRPVINVSWNDAQEYVEWLSRKTGKSYRLLSESEWEYVARAGTSTEFSTGDCLTTNQANFNGTYDFNGCGKSNFFLGKTQPVGSYDANPWGLHDVHGNVWEWTQDCWNDTYTNAPADGSAWLTGNCDRRVLRGGSWVYVPAIARSANRDLNSPPGRINHYGLRVARTL